MNKTAFGAEATEMTQEFRLISCDWPSEPIAEESRLFNDLANEWCEQTAGLPRVIDKLKHSTYQRIINWGENAVPHILADLRDNIEHPKHWFEALQGITGADPVPAKDRGDIRKMAEAWIKWGRDRGKIH